MSKFIRVYKILLITAMVVLFLFLIYQYAAFSGELTIKYSFCDDPSLITQLTPNGRALEPEKNLKTKECYQRMVGEPVYFTATAPRSFDVADVSLVYKNPTQSIIEMGIQRSIEWKFDLQPFENKFIDDSTWDRQDRDNIILLQKNKNFDSVDDFVNNIPIDTRIATYNYNLPYEFTIDNYQPSENILEINKTLRGRHEFYTYLEDENLDFTFTWQDINRAYPDDNFIVKIYKADTEIHNVVESSTDSDKHEKQVQLTNLSGGLYRIVIEVSDDILIHNIKTKQHLLVAKDKLFLVDNTEYGLEEKPSIVYTNSDEFLFKTDHPTGIQTVAIGEEEFSVDAMNKFLEWETQVEDMNTFKSMSVPRNDLIIQGYGYLAFSEDSYFDPNYKIDELRSTTDIEEYDYLVAANYESPQKERRWQTANTSFKLNGVPGDRKTLNFVLSAPELDEVKDDIIIKDVIITLNRPALTPKEILNKISNRF